ncbi:hypothetical protein OG788_07960 [Streptomyces sp. NBC_00647]|uniref:hypothetical protein n=1 Tax=Streptomyces sp. NBC_00647 TaxID=2975796 RepID=UPI00324852C3
MELNVKLEGDTIRAALAYERRTYLREMLKITVITDAFTALAWALNRGLCTPGGVLEPETDMDCTLGVLNWDNVVHLLLIFNVLTLGFGWIQMAAMGETVPRCSQPIYPLLKLLTASATVARRNARHGEAIKLGQQVSELGPLLRALARHVAEDFGQRRALRRALTTHLSRVDAAFIEVADLLAADRTASAKQLAELAALAANNIAAGHFTAILPAEALAEQATLEPDRLDGRRLATACRWAVVIVTVSFVVLSSLGAPAEFFVPPAFVVFPVLVYARLAFRYGLSEATRLTRSIFGFFPPNPPL